MHSLKGKVYLSWTWVELGREGWAPLLVVLQILILTGDYNTFVHYFLVVSMVITTYILNFSNSTLNLHSTTTCFPGGSAGKNTPAVQETWVQSLGQSGRSPVEGNGNPVQSPCLENSMDRGNWWAIVYGVAKSWTWLSDWHFSCKI